MNRLKDQLRNAGRVLLAAVAFALVPGAVEAAGIGFRNDTNHVICVQGSWVTKAGVKRGKLLVIKPGDTLWDNNLANGNRTITICDGNNRVLLLDAVNFDGINDQFFSVGPLAMPAKNVPRVKLNPQPVPVPAGGV